MKIEDLRVALVHDWLVASRGAERCLECFCELFPNADLFTLFHKKGSASSTIERRQINTSFLQKFPFWSKYYRYLYTFGPTAIEQFDFRGYDLVLSGSWCVAKGVIVPHDVLHISYIYSPMRYAWEMYPEYFGSGSMLPFWQRWVIPPQLNYLRMWDSTSSNRADHMVSVSKHIADRVQRAYGRESDVIYPPVDTDLYKLEAQKEDYYLMVTTFEPSKRVDIAVEAFNQLGFNLKIVGSTGRYGKVLKKFAEDNIEFLGWKPDEEVRDLYSKAKALVVPGVEDFGIVPLEAMSSGTPVIAFAGGGALETVIPANPPVGKRFRGSPTGMFFYRQTGHDLADVIKKFEKYDRTKSWDRIKLRRHAQKYNKKEFKKKFRKYISERYSSFSKNRLSAKVYK